MGPLQAKPNLQMPTQTYNSTVGIRHTWRRWVKPDLAPVYVCVFGGVFLASAAGTRTLSSHNEVILNKRAKETSFLEAESPKFMPRSVVMSYLPEEMKKSKD